MTLVRLRGGLDGINTNNHIKRVVIWADILHATAHSLTPQFELAQGSAHQEMDRLLELVLKHTNLTLLEDNSVPSYFQDILRVMRALAMAKSMLIKKEFRDLQELRLIFSSLLFVIEHRILEMGNTMPPSKYTIGNASAIETVKSAALIFTIHGLRDLAITAAFYDSLVRRLRDGLCGIVNDVYQNHFGSNSDEPLSANFLLWLCLNGWKASVTKSRKNERKPFIEKAAVLCESLKIDSSAVLYSHISNIVLLPDYHKSACSGLWADICTRTSLFDSNWEAYQ